MVFPGVSFGLQFPTFNKYVVIGAAVAGLSGVAATVYFYRRRKELRSGSLSLELLAISGKNDKTAAENEVRTKNEATNTSSSVSRLPLANNKLTNELKPKPNVNLKPSKDLTQTAKFAKSESSVKDKRAKKYTRSNTSMNVMSVKEQGSNDSLVPTSDAYVIKTKKRNSLKMYENALELVAKGEVKCRKIRTGMKFVRSEEDFLAKVHCLRQGFGVMFRTENVDSWIGEAFGSIAARILNTTNNIEYFKSANFGVAYIDTLVFLAMEDNQIVIMKEIKHQGITHVSFYDIVLCFILMDMLEDIENQCKTITFPKRSIHLTDILRINPIIYAFQDMYRTKQKYGYHVNGFLARLYRACSCLAPALAIGLRGPTSYLKKASLSFKKETEEYMEYLFSFEKVRYTTPTEMAEDLFSLTKEHLTRLNETVIHIEKSKQADDAEN